MRLRQLRCRCAGWHTSVIKQFPVSLSIPSPLYHLIQLTDVLSAIRRYNPLYPLITGKTSLSEQRFPADVGYTFQGAVLSHRLFPGSFFRVPGSHLLSHAVSSIVSSAASVLTNVFGMGTGVSPKRIATGKFSLSELRICRLPLLRFRCASSQ